jgi:2-oxoisovalerate dehydrogenase E1 component
MHRNLGVFTGRKMPFQPPVLSSGREPCKDIQKGGNRSFHFGSNEHHIVGMISHLGPQNGVADGIALASQLKGERKVNRRF